MGKLFLMDKAKVYSISDQSIGLREFIMSYLDRLQNAMALAANAVFRESQSRAETKKQCILRKLVDQGPWSTSGGGMGNE